MKASEYSSFLVIRDLARFSGIAFKYPDRMTRTEAETVIAWAKTQPQVVAAATDRGNESHRAVALYKSIIDHYALEHPQSAAGEPEPWPERPGRGVATADNPFGDCFPDEAAFLHEWAQTQPEYRAALDDKSHPRHAEMVGLALKVQEAATPADGDAPMQETSGGGKPDAATQQRIDTLRNDPAYMDKNHPNHKAVIDEIHGAYEAAAAGKSAPLPPGSAAPAQKSPQARIAALKDNAAYWDKSHPGHAAAVQEGAQAYADAFPEPPPMP